MKSKNSNKFHRMTQDERFFFMATADRVTIGQIWQIEDFDKKTLKCWHVAKVRGIIVSDGGTYKFDTEAQALEFGCGILAGWKRELAERLGQ